MILTRTPIRISFLGGGSDYPCWFKKHGGLVVGGSIDKHSYLWVSLLPPFHDFKTRAVYSLIETVKDNSEIKHRAIKACLDFLQLSGPEGPGLEIFHASDVPGRSGTGSSSSFVVGLLNALSCLRGRYVAPAELAEAATAIEQEWMGETVGCQDQAWAAHGGLNVIKFRQSGEVSVFPLGLSHAEIVALEQHCLLFFNGQSRTSSDVAKSYAPSLGTRDREQWAMLRLAEQGIDAVQAGKYERLGVLIDQAWRIKAGLAEGVSTAEVSAMYNTARLCGAWGGKLMGAGGGGCVFLVAPPEKHPAIIAALGQLGAFNIPFHFDFDGSRVVYADRERQRRTT